MQTHPRCESRRRAGNCLSSTAAKEQICSNMQLMRVNHCNLQFENLRPECTDSRAENLVARHSRKPARLRHVTGWTSQLVSGSVLRLWCGAVSEPTAVLPLPPHSHWKSACTCPTLLTMSRPFALVRTHPETPTIFPLRGYLPRLPS